MNDKRSYIVEFISLIHRGSLFASHQTEAVLVKIHSFFLCVPETASDKTMNRTSRTQQDDLCQFGSYLRYRQTSLQNSRQKRMGMDGKNRSSSV